MRGIKVFGKEIKLSQFADDTTLFNVDIESLERALKIVGDFGRIAGPFLNVKKTKALWLGKWKNNRNKPLQELITRSLQLPYIPITAFSQTNLFLVWIYLEFRFPQEPQ